MMSGLRLADSAQLQRICGSDMKSFLRVGALLQQQLSFSALALESMLASAEGRSVVADRRLAHCTPAEFSVLAQELLPAEHLTMIDASTGGEGRWRVIVLEDELHNPLLDASTASAATAASAAAAPPAAASPATGLGIGAGSPATAEPVHQATVDLLPAEHVTHLTTLAATLTPAIRVPLEGLLHARADDQRAAALEQLRYAMPPLPVVSELMPMILSDGAELVRERGLGLLVAAGAHSLVVDLIRALIRRDEQALARWCEPASRLSLEQQDLVISAVLAAISRGDTSQSLVELCVALAPTLVRHRHLPRLLELLLPSRLSLLELVRSLQETDSARVHQILLAQLGLSNERDALLVVLLADPSHPPAAGPELERVLLRGLELLLATGAMPPERMALAAALHRLDHGGFLARALSERGMALGLAYDTSVYWLLSELCRDGAVDAPSGELLATTVRRLLRDAQGPHLIAILEQQLPALLPASDSVRASMIEPLVETVARFIDERSRDLVISCLGTLGHTAVEPLWQLLEEHPHQTIRLLGAELLPELLSGADGTTVGAAARRMLRGLSRAEQQRERAALLTAAARLAALPVLSQDREIVATIDQGLHGLGRLRTPALGYLGSAAALSEERRGAIVGELLEELVVDVPDAPVQTATDPATSEVTFILDERLGEHTDNMPLVLSALQRIGSAPQVPKPVLRTIVARLCLQWRRVSQWQVIWGPGNIQALAQTLGAMAEVREFPGPLRLQVCEALMPSIAQLSISRSLARVFLAAEGSFLSALAGKAANRMVDLSAEGYYAEDEQEALAEILVDYLAIPHLGSEGAMVRRRLINVITVSRSHLTSRARAKLRYLTGELDPDLRAKLDWSV